VKDANSVEEKEEEEEYILLWKAVLCSDRQKDRQQF
jgi:hypothetical protein